MDRNIAIKVNSQKEANEVLDSLESNGNNVDKDYDYFKEWCWIGYDGRSKDWHLMDISTIANYTITGNPTLINKEEFF